MSTSEQSAGRDTSLPIAAAESVAAAVTGSASMLAEAAHTTHTRVYRTRR